MVCILIIEVVHDLFFIVIKTLKGYNLREKKNIFSVIILFVTIITNCGEIECCLAKTATKSDQGAIDLQCKQVFDSMASNSGKPEGKLFSSILTNAENSKLISNSWKMTLEEYGKYRKCRPLAR